MVAFRIERVVPLLVIEAGADNYPSVACFSAGSSGSDGRQCSSAGPQSWNGCIGTDGPRVVVMLCRSNIGAPPFPAEECHDGD